MQTSRETGGFGTFTGNAFHKNKKNSQRKKCLDPADARQTNNNHNNNDSMHSLVKTTDCNDYRLIGMYYNERIYLSYGES